MGYEIHIGKLEDDFETDNLQVSLDDLRKYKDKYHNDYKRIIKAIESEKRTERTLVFKPEKKNKVSTWTIITVVMVILSVLYLVWMGRQH